jgi:hypothetical protein
MAMPDDAARPQAMPWDDPDVAWLTGLHEAGGDRYFNKEAHEQMLWWLALPDLVALVENDPAGKSPATCAALSDLAALNAKAVTAAAAAGYKLDSLLQPTQQHEKSIAVTAAHVVIPAPSPSSEVKTVPAKPSAAREDPTLDTEGDSAQEEAESSAERPQD